MKKDNLPYIAEIVRKHDPDRFLISLFAPEDKRHALWALFAFNYEIAKTREVVTDTTLGLIRLQWWRDELAKIYDHKTPSDNEILFILKDAIHTYDLDQDEFMSLLHAREFDLENVLPTSIKGLGTYIDHTQAPLIRLATQIWDGSREGEDIEHLASGYGLIGMLRAVPFHASQERCYIPSELLSKFCVSEEGLYKGEPESGFIELISELVSIARVDLETIKRTDNEFVRLSQIIAELYLEQITSLKGNIFNPRMGEGPAFFHLRFLWRKIFK